MWALQRKAHRVGTFPKLICFIFFTPRVICHPDSFSNFWSFEAENINPDDANYTGASRTLKEEASDLHSWFEWDRIPKRKKRTQSSWWRSPHVYQNVGNNFFLKGVCRAFSSGTVYQNGKSTQCTILFVCFTPHTIHVCTLALNSNQLQSESLQVTTWSSRYRNHKLFIAMESTGVYLCRGSSRSWLCNALCTICTVFFRLGRRLANSIHLLTIGSTKFSVLPLWVSCQLKQSASTKSCVLMV